MKNKVVSHVVSHVIDNIGFVCYKDVMDKPWWTMNSIGKFTTKSAWELLKQRANENEDLREIWIKVYHLYSLS